MRDQEIVTEENSTQFDFSKMKKEKSRKAANKGKSQRKKERARRNQKLVKKQKQMRK